MNRSATEPKLRNRSAPYALLRHRRTERGAGLLSSVIGIGIVVALVGLVANVAVGLWIRSTVDSVAYDAARHVAASPSGREPNLPDEVVEAESIARARRLLGEYGKQVSMEFLSTNDPETVALRVRSPGTSLLPRMFRGRAVVGRLDRTIVIQREPRP